MGTLASTPLLPATQYYVRAFAKNSVGTSYGSYLPFMTACANGASNPPGCTDRPLTPTVSLTANPISITLPTRQSQFTWTTTNSPTSCTATTKDSWTGLKNVGGGGPETVTGIDTVGANTYTLTCTNAFGTASDTATVTVGAQLLPGICSSAPAGHAPSESDHKNPCSQGSLKDPIISSPSQWTWYCKSPNGGSDSIKCFEKKSPGYIEQ
jgi:hypothetical protein